MLLDEARVAALVKHPERRRHLRSRRGAGPLLHRDGVPRGRAAARRACAPAAMASASIRCRPGGSIADTAEGLDAAHELRSMSGERIELVHHDISLGNIVVLYNGQVKLVDFGVAKATPVGGDQDARCRASSATWRRRSSRGLTGDRRSDIFSLGCVMWEALTLQRLFRGGNDGETMKQVLELDRSQPPSKVNGESPPEFDAIVMRALERDPDSPPSHREGARGRDRRGCCASAATARRTIASRATCRTRSGRTSTRARSSCRRSSARARRAPR